jgi:protein phosphatase
MTPKAEATAAPPLLFQSVSRTHLGKLRTENEDRVLESVEQGLWAVADGMGGHVGGAMAASRLVDALGGLNAEGGGFSRLRDVTREVATVNATLFSDRLQRREPAGGTTLVALLLHETHYACLWAGDSRGYLFRRGRLSPITRDHSVVQELVDAGALVEDARRAHPRSNVITRAIGVGPAVELEQRFAAVNDGDVFLLCSDGLLTGLDDAAIAHILSGMSPSKEGLAEAADHLLAAALRGSAPDNISFVIVLAGQGV